MIGTMVHSWVRVHVRVTQSRSAAHISRRMGFVHAKGSWHSCEVGRGQGPSLHLCCWSLEGFFNGALFFWFDLVQLPSNSSITHLNSHGHCHFLLSLWFFPSFSHEKEIFKCNPSLMAGQHLFQSNRTNIFTFYILNTREIDMACRSPGGFEVMEHLCSSHQLKLLPWHLGMNTDKGIKRWTDLMHGLDTAVPGNLTRLKSTQIRHYCLTRNYRLHCRSKEKRTNPDRIHNNYFTCLEEPSASKQRHGHIRLWWRKNKQRGCLSVAAV